MENYHPLARLLIEIPSNLSLFLSPLNGAPALLLIEIPSNVKNELEANASEISLRSPAM